MHLKIIPKTWAQLTAMLTPSDPRQPESVPYILYDTQQYVSGATTLLSFFQTVNPDKTLTNMETSGVLPAPQHFEIHSIFVDVLNRPSVGAGTVAGQIDDLSALFHIGRATITYASSGKRWGPIPARACGPISAINGAVGATLTAPANIQAGWRDYNGGFPINGQFIIPPSQSFGFDMAFAAAQTLAGGNTYISMSLLGVLHRRVS